MVLGGTPIPLPNEDVVSGVTTSGADSVFTVPESGTYQVSYTVRTAASLVMGSRVTVNGAAFPALTAEPQQSTALHTGTAMLVLAAGSTLRLEFFGLLGAVTLQSGSGTSLSIVRLS